MINDVMIERLDELIGDFNTPFFNYLLYSYDLSLDECEGIIDELKEDINSGEVISDNMVSTLDGRFKSRVTDLEKREKVEFLSGLIQEDNDFYIRYLKRYDLSSEDVDLIYERVESKIMEDDITDDYDTLIIQSQKRAYPILQDRDIVDIVFSIHGDIIEAKEFRNGIKSEFKRQCMIRSEDKKAKCRQNLNVFVEGSGDSFSKLVKFKGLTKKDGEIIVSSIRQDINEGLIQPDSIDSVFITKRFNDYNEGQ